MSRLVGSLLIYSLFLFFLSLPLLHLHPASGHGRSGIIHTHLPDHAEDHYPGTTPGANLDHDESSMFKAISIEIAALCASAVISIRAPGYSALPETGLQLESDLQFAFIKDLFPQAKSPPGCLICSLLRGPPA